MLNINSPQNILIAVTRIRDELPTLVDDKEWETIRDTLFSTIQHLSDCSDSRKQFVLASEIVSTLAPYDDARARLRFELILQGILQEHIAPQLNTFVNNLKIDYSAIPTLATASNAVISWSWDALGDISPEHLEAASISVRGIEIPPGGIGGAKSIKFKNLNLDLGEMSKIAAGAMLAGFSMIEKPHILVIIGGILLTICALTEAMSVEITEQEASVFWGFILTRDKNNVADEASLLTNTNIEREHCGLEPLTERQFRYSLVKLEQLKCIQSIEEQPEHWRIIENYKITD